jgi:hypothetical protein
MAKVCSQDVNYPDKNDSSFIKIKEYYRGRGKIYSLRNNNPLPSYTKDIFTPTAIEILSAEQLMNEKYSDLVKSDERAKSLLGTTYKQYYYK